MELHEESVDYESLGTEEQFSNALGDVSLLQIW